MGLAGVLRGWEELGCSEPNMLLDVRSDGFLWFFQKSVLAALYSSEGSVMEVPPFCPVSPSPLSP